VSNYKYISLPRQTVIFGALTCFSLGFTTAAYLIEHYDQNHKEIVKDIPPISKQNSLKQITYNY
jgi:hypothetical protein